MLAFVVNLPIAFLVPSSSGHAALVMPILAPLAGFADVAKSIAVTAYQSASGLVNLITPTSAVIMGGLALSKVGYDRYLKFVWPFLVAVFVVVCASSAPRRRSAEPGKEQSWRTVTSAGLGANSEVGTLRTVIVHRPDLAHERLSPSNCHELLFDDVIWVRRARQEYDAFVDLMRGRGVEVLLFHDLSRRRSKTLRRGPGCRRTSCDRRRHRDVLGRADGLVTEMPADELATRITGGVTVASSRTAIAPGVGRALAPTDFVLAPLPNELFTRDDCLAVRRRGALDDVLARAAAGDAERGAVYRFHPRFRDAGARSGSAAPTTTGARPSSRAATSCRSATASCSSATRAEHRARHQHPRRRPVRAPAPRGWSSARGCRERAPRCTSTWVFTFCDRTVATLYEPVVSEIVPILYRPDGDGGVRGEVADRPFLDELKDALGLPRRRVVPTGGDEFEAERNQWDDGNNVVALSPGVDRRLRTQRGHQLQVREGRCGEPLHHRRRRSSAAAAVAATA